MPRLLIYNPTCEMAVHNGRPTYYTPPHLQQLEQDVAIVMTFLAEERDYLYAEKPDEELLQFFEHFNLKIPRFCTKQEAKNVISEGADIFAWGMSPKIYTLKTGKSFTQKERDFYSRKTSIEIEKLIQQEPLPPFLHTNFLPEIVDNIDNLPRRIPLIVKSLWSSSGRGNMMARNEKYYPSVCEFAKLKIVSDGAIIVEPLLQNLQEFSMMFYVDTDGVKYLGKNFFESDSQGKFGYELIGTQPVIDIPDWETTAVSILKHVILKWSEQAGYTGYVNFDSMYYDDCGVKKIRLCTEANLRLCMGNLNQEIAKIFSPKTRAKWTIHRFEKDEDWNDFCSRNKSEHPLKFDAEGLIESGFFRLSGLGKEKRFGVTGYATSL